MRVRGLLLTVFSISASVASAETFVDANGIKWAGTLSNDNTGSQVACICGYDLEKRLSGDIELPSYLSHCGSTAPTNVFPVRVVAVVDTSCVSDCPESGNLKKRTDITSIKLPSSVVTIGTRAFEGSSVTNVIMCEGLQDVRRYAFIGCTNLVSIVFPSTLLNVSAGIFEYCTRLESVTFLGDAPTVSDYYETSLYVDGWGGRCFWGNHLEPTVWSSMCDAKKIELGVTGPDPTTIPGGPLELPVEKDNQWYLSFNGMYYNSYEAAMEIYDSIRTDFEVWSKYHAWYDDLIYARPYTYIVKGTKGWPKEPADGLPRYWPGVTGRVVLRTIEPQSPIAQDVPSVSIIVTNVVVQYVLNSVKPEIAVPVSGDAGFVNVITEVKSSGAVAVPSEWKANYPAFETKFGTDFTKALMAKSGKVDAAKNELLVWQDFVAGTDPTDVEDKLTASVTMVEGVPVISWTPELPVEQANLRKYTTYGKAKLQDENWTVVNGDAANYNFFKVTVEMK